MFKRRIILFLQLILSTASASILDTYNVKVTSDSPIVKGGTINFSATVYDGDDIASGTFEYEWEDGAIPQHTRETGHQNSSDSWSVSYDASTYPMGHYIMQVKVSTCTAYFICYQVCSARYDFEITDTLNGNLLLIQSNKTRDGEYISNNDPVTHEVSFKKSDFDYIITAPTVLTYWFVDCTYYGITTDFKFPFNYTTADEEHIVEALVMADFTPLPTTTALPSTTTTKPSPTTATTIKPNTTTPTTPKPNSTNATTTFRPSTAATVAKADTKSLKSNVNTLAVTADAKHLHRRSVEAQTTTAAQVPKHAISKIMVNASGMSVPDNGSFPFVCNRTRVATDPQKTYGFFYRKILVKEPITKVNVSGNNWIQHGDLLSLNVNCQGSKNMEYCAVYRRGAYNVTGNETCYEYIQLDTCEFTIKRYLQAPKYTLLIIIKNDVSKVVQPVTVTIYEVITQGQLSVIVVPVAFSLVAVVLIVFGVAYYIQNRSRFLIEVADFNFGQPCSDMEYKTFRERLRDSILNAFTRGPSPSSSEVPVWPPGRKYGSMT